jgi:hypothetical protein
MTTLSNRAPLARNPMRLPSLLASDTLIKPSTELLMTSVPPSDDLIVKHIAGLFSGRVPLRTSSIASWPTNAAHLQCLHCGTSCQGQPVPAARKYDTLNDSYWVYGPFCRPCCSLGYICENDSTSKQLAPTVELLRRFFGMKEMHVAPPRQTHRNFGGPLSDAEFYGQAGFSSITNVQPPFVTFANYVIAVHQGLSSESKTHITALLPQSAGRLVGLERPAVRSVPLAEKKPSGRAPLILEFLASLTSISEVRDSGEAVEVKETKKRARTTETSTTNFLKQYVKTKA